MFKNEPVQEWVIGKWASAIFLSEHVVYKLKDKSINIQLRISYLCVSCENTKIVYGVYCVKPYDNAKPINNFLFIYLIYIYKIQNILSILYIWQR
jgi:hypothetical protein